MSYQVLARKYRPASFQDIEGQEHVLQALVNALDNERLHHAYLFTGTRGVGKTTIARILARCLNCESGLASVPCGECNTCLEITEGRSVDLIEVDAASRTGVDDMRELLDNVQYMPTVSRFKIYLIDEVHMLSRHSFNAMLKTLEEPPEHVKFLFATTDPKKLPVTVLSRCLQFNLKNLSPEQIVHHLGVVLDKESIDYDEAALWQLGHAADGSMRDALSLADQAISFGGNEVRDVAVKSMLGSIDYQEVYDLIDAVIAEDGARLIEKIAALSEFAPDYSALLDNILAVLHRVAIAHAVPDAVDNAQGDRVQVLAAAQQVSAEHVQLLYQIGLIGQRDMSLAPMPRIGFEMVLLRMMSFTHEGPDPEMGTGPDSTPGHESGQEPESGRDASSEASASKSSPIAGLVSAMNGESVAPKVAVPVPSSSISSSISSSASASSIANSPTRPQSKTRQSESPLRVVSELAKSDPVEENRSGQLLVGSITEVTKPEPKLSVATQEPQRDKEPQLNEEPQLNKEPQRNKEPQPNRENAPEFSPANWAEILEALSLSGVAASLAANCELYSANDLQCVLKLSENHAGLWNKTYEGRIAEALGQLYGHEIQVLIEVGALSAETPAQSAEREKQQSLAKAVADIQGDQHVQQLIESFNGKLDPKSISPLGN
ncbi:DNA polymerase III subunit gamma/tau [Gammaproteobacteria bacterium]|nr:DNA polymerase III subunit gamma/tau [Gammaproteobacteria bacterium]